MMIGTLHPRLLEVNSLHCAGRFRVMCSLYNKLEFGCKSKPAHVGHSEPFLVLTDA
jgi:hypothetical protein